MKWKQFINPRNGTWFTPGDWNAIDDRSGKKVKASAASKQWDGFMTTQALRRHEQDFLRGIKERIRTPWNRTEGSADVFVNAAAIVTNGNFITDTAWTKGASWSIDTDKQAASYAAGTTDTMYQDVNAVSGATYEVVYTVFNYVGAGSVTASIGTASGTARTSDGTYTENITSAGTTPSRLTFTPGAGGTSFDIDYVRVLRVG